MVNWFGRDRGGYELRDGDGTPFAQAFRLDDYTWMSIWGDGGDDSYVKGPLDFVLDGATEALGGKGAS